MSNKQSSKIVTSTDWLSDKIQEFVISQDLIVKKLIIEISFEDYMNFRAEAKAMHKEQCINYAHDFARQMLQNRRFVTPEIIYNETFGGNNEQQ